jgi:hypothetical protein
MVIVTVPRNTEGAMGGKKEKYEGIVEEYGKKKKVKLSL